MDFFLIVFFALLSLLVAIANGITNLADVSCGKQLLLAQRVKVGREQWQQREREYQSYPRQSKVVNGTDAYHGEFPWIASIKFRATNNHFCGGSIFHKRYVLSAAHCFVDFKSGFFSLNKIKVTLGEHDVAKEETPIDSEVDVGIQQLIFHEGFQTKGYINDIVILELDTDVTWSPYIWPACLPDSLEKLEGSKAIVAGWGQVSDELSEPDSPNKVLPDILQKVDVPILESPVCKNWFRDGNVNWAPLDSHLCAGYQQGGKDSCQGDSGGPLMVKKREELCLVGIVAAGRGCGKPGLPGVYTRVSSYLDWIQSKISV